SRCVGDDVHRLVAVGDEVPSLLHCHRHDGGHRLDALDVNLGKLLDEAENSIQLAGHPVGFLLADGDAGKMGDAFDGGEVDGHDWLRWDFPTGYNGQAARAQRSSPPRGGLSRHQRKTEPPGFGTSTFGEAPSIACTNVSAV